MLCWEIVGNGENTGCIIIFVKHACHEQDMAVTMTVGVCACVLVCVLASEFVRTITYTIVDGFQNNLTQLSSITCRCAI